MFLTSIVIKVRCGGQPRHHGAASRERKLTMTLFIVTVVSLLLCLPHVIWKYVLYISKYAVWQSLSFTVAYHLDHALLVLIHANSFVNPLLYAPACLNTDQLYLHSFANELSNKDGLQFYLCMTCNADNIITICFTKLCCFQTLHKCAPSIRKRNNYLGEQIGPLGGKHSFKETKQNAVL